MSSTLPLNIVRDVDDLLVRAAATLINRVAAKRRVPPYYLALDIPGVCHAHLPDERPQPGCAYCRRRGTTGFGGGESSS